VLAERGDASGWFAEYAMAQLAPGANCSSRPAWVAWTDAAALGNEELVVALWSQDARAARRAILALQLHRATSAVHILLPRAFVPQLERCANERDDTELELHGDTLPQRAQRRAEPPAAPVVAAQLAEREEELAELQAAIEALRTRMRAAAGQEEFEEAARLRDQIRRATEQAAKAEGARAQLALQSAHAPAGPAAAAPCEAVDSAAAGASSTAQSSAAWPAWTEQLPAALRPATHAPRPYECWATLAVRGGEALQRLQASRQADAASSHDAAMAKLQELSRRLLARDPAARLVMSAEEEPRGRLVISEAHFNGHVLSWDGVVDRYSNVDDLVRIATMACDCC
jgi:hypothetical protein